MTLGPMMSEWEGEEVKVRDGSRPGSGCREEDPLGLLILRIQEHEYTAHTPCPPPRPLLPGLHLSQRLELRLVRMGSWSASAG